MPLSTFLFWNLNRRPLLDLVTSAVREHHVDVLVLAECELSPVALLETLNDGELAQFTFPINLSDHFTILIRYPSQALQPVRDMGRIAIRRLVPPIGQDLILVAVHVPSKLHMSEIDQTMYCVNLARYVGEAERNFGHTRTIIFGDFNMNPFEAGMVTADGLHAVMSRRVAARGQRTIQGEPRRFFFNPMWSFFGDLSPGPSGTYYYGASGQISYYWNKFDQVLVRPELLSMFDERDVSVITSIGSISLLSEEHTPDNRVGSDHLPVLFRLSLE